MSAAEEIVRDHSWAVISRTATPGFLAGIGDDMLRRLDELGDGPPSRKITALSAACFGLTTHPRNGPWTGATGDIFRANVKDETPAKKYLGNGDFVPDSVTNKMVCNRVSESDVEAGFLLDGYPGDRCAS